MSHIEQRENLINLLIVEDDQPTRELFDIWFSRAGFSTTLMSDCSELYDYLKIFRPDLILLDSYLPYGITGIDATRQIRANPTTANLPIIIHSVDQNQKRYAMEAGATDFMLKPASKKSALAIVMNALSAVDATAFIK